MLLLGFDNQSNSVHGSLSGRFEGYQARGMRGRFRGTHVRRINNVGVGDLSGWDLVSQRRFCLHKLVQPLESYKQATLRNILAHLGFTTTGTERVGLKPQPSFGAQSFLSSAGYDSALSAKMEHASVNEAGEEWDTAFPCLMCTGRTTWMLPSSPSASQAYHRNRSLKI